jgi:capsular polysaccharide biosynthesis protein
MVRLFLLRFFETYFRHRWLYLLPVVIVMGAAAGYLYFKKPTYTAWGILYVNNPSLLTSLTAIQNNNTSWWITPAQATTNEINELLQTDAFVRAVIRETDLEEFMDDGLPKIREIISGVRRGVRVSPAGNNQLYIYATTEFPEISYQLVPAVINSYTTWKINTERQDSLVAKEFFQELIEKYTAELEIAREVLADYYDANPAPMDVTQRMIVEQYQSQILLAGNRYNSALEKEENANLAMAQLESDIRQTYVLVDAPHVPDKPDLSNRKLATQAAAFVGVGILLSLITIAGASLLDRTFRFPVDIENHLELAVLAVTPDVSPRRKWYQRLKPNFLRKEKPKVNLESSETPIVKPLGKEATAALARSNNVVENKNYPVAPDLASSNQAALDLEQR